MEKIKKQVENYKQSITNYQNKFNKKVEWFNKKPEKRIDTLYEKNLNTSISKFQKTRNNSAFKNYPIRMKENIETLQKEFYEKKLIESSTGIETKNLVRTFYNQLTKKHDEDKFIRNHGKSIIYKFKKLHKKIHACNSDLKDFNEKFHYKMNKDLLNEIKIEQKQLFDLKNSLKNKN